jgi:DNA-binding transcriptional ArsR family regulator
MLGMPEQTSIATNYARALADPVRLGIVAALDNGPRSIDSLARQLGVSKQHVSRHARALAGMGLVCANDDESRTYQLLREPVIWEQAWDELPIPARRECRAAGLASVNAAATAAIDAGGFDRPDSYFTRTTVRMSQELWCQVAERLGDMLRFLDAADDDPSGTPATVVTMLFSGEHADAAPPETQAPEFGEDEAREHTYELVEQLTELMAGLEPSPWGRIAALAEQLRLVARAADVLDTANQPAQEPAERE